LTARIEQTQRTVRLPSLYAFYIRDDGVVAGGTGGLRADQFGSLQLTLAVGGPDLHLVFSGFRWAPTVVPDDPGIGGEGRLQLSVVPGLPRVKTEFHF